MGRSFKYRSPSSIKRSTGRLVAFLHKMIKIIRRMTFNPNEVNTEKLLDPNNDTSRCSGNSLENFDSHSFITSTPVKSKEICRKCNEECIKRQHWKSRLKKKPDYMARKQLRLLDISSLKPWPHSGLQQVAV